MNYKIELAKKILNNRSSYFLASMGVNLKTNNFMRDALLFSLNETRKAYLHEKPVYWCSTFVPSELIYALGGVPFMPEVAAGFSARLGLAEDFIIRGESEWLNSDLCSIHRCGMGLTLTDLMPEPDYIIASSHLCDGAKKYLKEISMIYNCPFFLLDVPYDIDNAEWLAAQIERIIKKIKYQDLQFKSVFIKSNRAYTYNQKINKLREKKPCVISGEQMMNLVPLSFMSFGTDAGVKFYYKLLKELRDRLENNRSLIKKEKYRLLWLHLKPYYKQEIFSLLQAKGAVIAFEEYSQLYWSPLDYRKPYLSLAHKMINHFGWGKLDNQLKRIYKIINNYDLDGVIGFSHWGCRQSSGRMNIIKSSLKEKSIPFLNLDGDLIDHRNYREEQLRTRVEAFIELLAARKEYYNADGGY